MQRWRLTLAREPVGDLGQREQLAAWEAMLAASGLPLAGLDAASPRPRFALAAPLAASLPGEAELVDLWLVERLPVWRVREALDGRLPVAYRLVDLFDVWLGEPALPGQVVASVYRAELAPGADAARLRAAAASMLAAGTLPRSRRKGESSVAYDLRPFLDGLDVVTTPGAETPALRMTLRHDAERGIGRPEEVVGEIGDRLGTPLAVVRLVRERLVLGASRPGTPGRSPGTAQAASSAGRRGRR
ncbi:MAG: DUF2344 domain-containing protein [Chloroflexota bacterium]